MGFGVLFISILGGYLFIQRCHFTRLTGSRESGYHVLFRSAVPGALFLAGAWAIETFLLKDRLPADWYEIEPFKNTITLALPLLLGPSFALLVNCFYGQHRASTRAMLNDNDSLERLLFHVALYEDLMVEMTLSSGKVYVGWVLGGTAIRDRKYVEIMPVVSGYREKETRKVWFTTKYANVLAADSVNPADFRVVVPISEISSARPFIMDVYERFQSAHRATVTGNDEGGPRQETGDPGRESPELDGD